MRGYLHTIHMPAMRHQQTKSLNLKSNSTMQNRSQLSVTSTQTEGGGEISLKRLFIQPGNESSENQSNINNAISISPSEMV